MQAETEILLYLTIALLMINIGMLFIYRRLIEIRNINWSILIRQIQSPIQARVLATFTFSDVDLATAVNNAADAWVAYANDNIPYTYKTHSMTTTYAKGQWHVVLSVFINTHEDLTKQ